MVLFCLFMDGTVNMNRKVYILLFSETNEEIMKKLFSQLIKCHLGKKMLF